MFCALGVSCSKSHEVRVIAHSPKYWQPDGNPANAVTNFLTYAVPAGDTEVRNNWPNTDLDEGRWLIEASFNYLHNSRLATEIIDATEVYNFEIANTFADGQMQLEGSDLTAKFAQLQAELAATETTVRKTAGIDVEISEVTETVTRIAAKVIYTVGAPEPVNPDAPDALRTYEYARPFVNLFVNSLRNQVIQDHIDNCTEENIWYPDLHIASLGEPTASDVDYVKEYYPNTELPLTCSEEIAYGNGKRCMISWLDPMSPYQYGTAYFGVNETGGRSDAWKDAHVALQITEEYIQDAENAQSDEWEEEFIYLPAGITVDFGAVPMHFELPYFQTHDNPNELDDYSEFYGAASAGCDDSEECQLRYFFVSTLS